PFKFAQSPRVPRCRQTGGDCFHTRNRALQRRHHDRRQHRRVSRGAGSGAGDGFTGGPPRPPRRREGFHMGRLRHPCFQLCFKSCNESVKAYDVRKQWRLHPLLPSFASPYSGPDTSLLIISAHCRRFPASRLPPLQTPTARKPAPSRSSSPSSASLPRWTIWPPSLSTLFTSLLRRHSTPLSRSPPCAAAATHLSNSPWPRPWRIATASSPPPVNMAALSPSITPTASIPWSCARSIRSEEHTSEL